MIQNLLALQSLLLPPAPPSPERQAKIAELKKSVPPPVLTHFERMVSRGKNGVALVRHGVCSECHIRVPVGTLASLVTPHDVYLCDSCSCYLLLPPDESLGDSIRTRAKPVARPTRAKKTTAVIVPAPADDL